ncbi:anti-sigma factor antagonist [Sulfurifustis variabilis]|uniref:Anti-sigma factor antagonist n=1 Tax=Sulfurifustis variabilis TaxID=1675686 RepID=A0A1B4V3V5_9GAMM|nr:sigma-E factor negative regulatory protein [Sulfurifustis variabilis]BAU48223.1 anti-sigma factor antagonist [Sulfurifustis variabilis]
MKEKLSAFIDAELTELEERHVLAALASDAELRSAWERYHLIRAAMMRQVSMLAPAGLAERVVLGIAEQPVKRATPKYWHYAAGAGVAATVAALAIFGLQTLHRPAIPGVPSLARINAPASQPGPPTAQGLNPYLVGHSEFMPTAGMGGMLPYVRVVTLDPDK